MNTISRISKKNTISRILKATMITKNTPYAKAHGLLNLLPAKYPKNGKGSSSNKKKIPLSTYSTTIITSNIAIHLTNRPYLIDISIL